MGASEEQFLLWRVVLVARNQGGQPLGRDAGVEALRRTVFWVGRVGNNLGSWTLCPS